MAAVTDSGDYECVICREVYDTPKILPCYHQACRDCVRSWLARAQEGGGGCPLCRATILPPSHPPQGDLDSAVNALPTNVLIQSLVKGHQVVTGPRVCAVCPGGTATASCYCFDCGVKLCATCSVQHRKSPGTRKHELQDLKALTAGEVAARFRWSCPHHPDKLVTAHCGEHGLLVCALCETTKHRSCRGVRLIGEVARQKRREGRRLVKRWRAKEAALAEQIKSRKDKYDQQQKEAKMVFDQLHTMLDRRYEELYDVIQRRKDGDVDLEKARATMMSHILIMKQMLGSNSDDVMLQMTKELESRSVEVESACGRADNLEDVQDLQLDSQRISNIKSALSALGQERAVPPKATAVYAPAPAAPATTRISSGMPVTSPSTPAVRTTSSSSPTAMSVTRHSAPPPWVALEEPHWFIPSPPFEPRSYRLGRIIIDDPTVEMRLRRGRLRYGRRAIDRFSCERHLVYMMPEYVSVHPPDDTMPEYEDGHRQDRLLQTLFLLAVICFVYLGPSMFNSP